MLQRECLIVRAGCTLAVLVGQTVGVVVHDASAGPEQPGGERELTFWAYSILGAKTATKRARP